MGKREIMKAVNYFKDNIKGTVWRYYAFCFLRSLGFFGAVLVPFYTQWGHITLLQVQLLQSWFMLWAFLLEIPTGVIADHFGRKVSITLGIIILALAVLVYGSVPSFKIFMLGEFLAALASALISGADGALLYDTLKEAGREGESKNIFGRARAFGLAGIFFAAPVGGLIAYKISLNAPMLLSAIPFLLAAIVAWSLKEPKINQRVSESKRYLETAKNGFKFLYQHKSLRVIALDSILVAAAAYFILWLNPALLLQLKVPLFYFGFIQAFLVAAQILVASNFTRLENIFRGPKNLLTFSALATAVGFILVALMPNLLTEIIFLVLAGGFGLTRAELMGAYMNKFIESHQRATVLSSISMLRRISLVVLNPLVGLAADHSLNLALLLLGVLPLLVFLFSPLKKEILEEIKS